jgi:tripartite-type tricarboxylate transporter receptor subunit TctC
MRAVIIACTLAAAFVGCPDAGAQYPNKPVRIIMPFPAGATADTVMRIIAAPLSEVLGQPVIVDNRPGADGAIAGELAARAPADGYSLFSAGNTQMLGVPTLRKNPPYDPVRDFAPITQLVRFAFFLVVHPGTPVKTVAELVDYARAHPGRLNYASGNVNGILAAAQLMSLTGVNMLHVPYKGEPLAISDLLEARVHLMFGTGGVVAPLVKERRLRALATLAPVRTALLPDVPTVAETGMPRLSVAIWNGLFAPAKTPAEIVERLSRELNAILQRRDVHEQLAKQGVEPSGSTPAEFTAFVKQQLADWGKAAREAGMSPE